MPPIVPLGGGVVMSSPDVPSPPDPDFARDGGGTEPPDASDVEAGYTRLAPHLEALHAALADAAGSLGIGSREAVPQGVQEGLHTRPG